MAAQPADARCSRAAPGSSSPIAPRSSSRSSSAIATATSGRRSRCSSYGYAGWPLFADGARPLAAFDVERDQLAIIRRDPCRELMPPEYVNDFLFLPAGVSPPRELAG